MDTREWFQSVLDALPSLFSEFMKRDFTSWEEEIDKAPEDFVLRVRDYITEHIGKSSTSDLSVRIFAVMDGKSKEEVFQEFMMNGY